MPSSEAFWTIISMSAIFSSRFAGSPSSDKGSNMNIAPYFLTIGKSLSSLTRSADTELTRALPGYFRRAASSTSTWLESSESGREDASVTSSRILSIISFSSIPLIPTLISSKDAPLASCSSAKSSTMDRLPLRSSSWSFFFPVGLILSPTIISGESRLKARVFLSDVRKRCGNLWSVFCSCSFLTICSFPWQESESALI